MSHCFLEIEHCHQHVRVFPLPHLAPVPLRLPTQAAHLTWQREGIRGFYKGLAPALVRVMPQSALTLVVYENVLRLLQEHSARAAL